MSIFEQEVRERAKLSRGARHKINGSKSKRVTLPIDHMTKTQISRRSGTCRTYRMGDPNVPEEELATWPEDLRAEYRNTYGR